jgi:hypothetical protein
MFFHEEEDHLPYEEKLLLDIMDLANIPKETLF